MSRATGIPVTVIEAADKDDPNGSTFELLTATPGAIRYWRDDERGVTGFTHSCPCGCGALGTINLTGPAGERPMWTNSGTREKPTLSPSIGFGKGCDYLGLEADGYHWHGYIRDGIWESC